MNKQAVKIKVSLQITKKAELSFGELNYFIKFMQLSWVFTSKSKHNEDAELSCY